MTPPRLVGGEAGKTASCRSVSILESKRYGQNDIRVPEHTNCGHSGKHTNSGRRARMRVDAQFLAVVVSRRAAPQPRRDAPGDGRGPQVDRHGRVSGPRRRAHRHRASACTRGGLSRGSGHREGLRAEERREETLDQGGEVRAQQGAGPGAESYRAAPGPRGVPRGRRPPGRRRRPGRRGEAEGARRGSAAPMQAKRGAGRAARTPAERQDWTAHFKAQAQSPPEQARRERVQTGPHASAAAPAAQGPRAAHETAAVEARASHNARQDGADDESDDGANLGS